MGDEKDQAAEADEATEEATEATTEGNVVDAEATLTPADAAADADEPGPADEGADEG